ncbi:MAG: thioredoxin-like domain-containing protein [Kiritimatiellia bacterium]
MRTLYIFKATCLLLSTTFLLTVSAAEPGQEDYTGMREWTKAKGNKFKASYFNAMHGNVYLKKENGKTIKIKKSALSAEDQAIVDRLSGSAIQKALAAKKTDGGTLPKAPAEIYAMFGDKLRTTHKKQVSVDVLTDKLIGVYFSAHWCPPCQVFTPRLVKFYDSLKAAGKPFEIVFVSSDRSRDAMYEYMEEMKMNWFALPYGDSHRDLLSKRFGVRGIPTFVVLNSKGETITTNGRGEVMRGTSAFDAWEQKK